MGPLQRQGLSPICSVNSALLDLDSLSNDGNREKKRYSSQLSSEHKDVWTQARRCFVDTALCHMSRTPSWWSEADTEKWQVILSKIRFTVTSERLCTAVRLHKVNIKVGFTLSYPTRHIVHMYN